MLENARLAAFLVTAKPEECRAFYERLGLRFLKDDGFALCFDAHGTPLRVAKMKEVSPAPHTVLGWEVDDMDAALAGLARANVSPVRYPFLPLDARGVMTFPSGDQVAWFQDPDGNTLSIARMMTPA